MRIGVAFPQTELGGDAGAVRWAPWPPQPRQPGPSAAERIRDLVLHVKSRSCNAGSRLRHCRTAAVFVP